MLCIFRIYKVTYSFLMIMFLISTYVILATQLFLKDKYIKNQSSMCMIIAYPIDPHNNFKTYECMKSMFIGLVWFCVQCKCYSDA